MLNEYDRSNKCVNPDISIIVPVYNAEKYLSKCLDSLINQTYRNIEIICVNDGSKDSSNKILADYSNKDNRIIVITQENGGQSSARNNGLAVARAPYVMFVDSDDYIELDTCEMVYNEAIKEDADTVIFCNYLEYNGQKIPQITLGTERKVFIGEECQGFLLRRIIGLVDEELKNPEQIDKLSSVCTKLYRKKILIDNNIGFVYNDIVGPCEDTLFNIEFFLHTKKCVYIPSLLYYYLRINAKSTTSNYRDNLEKKFDSFYGYVYKNIILSEELKWFYEVIEKAFKNRYTLSIISLGLNEIRAKESFLSKVKRISELIERPNYLESVKALPLTYMKFYWKVFFICVKYRLDVFVTLLLIIIEYLRYRRKKK